MASENGARCRAPGARISVSKRDVRAISTADPAFGGDRPPPRFHGTNSAPSSAVMSGSDRRAAGPKPNGSATVTGRSTNDSSCETSVTATRSPRKRLQSEQRLQAGDAAADDHDLASVVVAFCHVHSPGVVGTCVGSSHRGHVTGAFVRGLVGARGHRQHAAHLVDRFEALARHPTGEAVEQLARVRRVRGAAGPTWSSPRPRRRAGT